MNRSGAVVIGDDELRSRKSLQRAMAEESDVF